MVGRKFGKDLESQGKVREFENNGCCSLQKLYLFRLRGKNVLSSLRVQAHLHLIRDCC